MIKRKRNTAAIALVGILLAGQTSFAFADSGSSGPATPAQPKVASQPANPKPATPASPTTPTPANPTPAQPAAPSAGTDSGDGTSQPDAASSSDSSSTDPTTTDSDATGPSVVVTSPSTPAITAPTPPTSPNVSGNQTNGSIQTTSPASQSAVPAWVLDTATNIWEASDPNSFYWDTTASEWLSPEYYYDPQDGYYEVIPTNVAVPGYMITAAGPVYSQTIFGNVLVGSQAYDVAKSMGLITGQAVLGTNLGVSPNSAGGANPNGWINLTSLIDLMNNVNSDATTGNATVADNTAGGDATSGLASAFAELINLLSSAWTWSNGSLNLFEQNITTQNGDVNLNPNTISDTGADLTVNNATANTIDNNVNLAAESGDADVLDNTGGGNATSGDAVAGVNIMNLIDSFITSGQSFFGILNIFGDLNGNIVFPSGFLTDLLGTSSPNSTNTSQSTTDNTADTNNSATDTVENSFDASAESGQANIGDNTAGGNATSGSADNGQSIFNMINTDLFANNAVLVIVNVMGQWVGKIFSVPGGSSMSALLTNGGTTSANETANAQANNSQQNTIVNNVTDSATTGDANVADNGEAGNATTGNADVANNAANIVGSNLNVQNWFGVLFINVFGDWDGSITNGVASTSDAPQTATDPTGTPVGIVALMASVSPSASNGTSGSGLGELTSAQNVTTGTPSGSANANSGVKLSASNIPAATDASTKTTADTFMLAAFIMMVAAGLAGLERKFRKA